MSQRPPAPRPASHSPPDGQRITLPPVQLRDEPKEVGREVERQQPEPEARALPQHQPSPQNARTSQTAPFGEDWRVSAPIRDLGVHTILNPTEPEGSGSSSRRLSVGTSGSPSTSGPASSFGASPLISTPQHTFPGPQQPSSTPPTAEGCSSTFPRPRRILTPRSPRVTSMGRGAQETINARRSPFLPSRGRTYTAEPGQSASSEVPPMPTPPGQSAGMQQYGFPQVSTPTLERRPSMATMQAPGRAPLSQSASPSISVSSQNPSAQTSPASFPFHKGSGGGALQTSGSYFPGSSFGSTLVQAPNPAQAQAGQGGMNQPFQGVGQGGQGAGGMAPSEGPYPPSAAPPHAHARASSTPLQSAPSSSRQTQSQGGQGPGQGGGDGPVQVLTITTSRGDTYTVPVDVHQASRLADEKRARNAGASARFRQRRKEKEREASTNIEKLQAQTRELERKVREVESERDWYRGERDRLRDVILRNEVNPALRGAVGQAPLSPRSSRAGMGGPGGHGIGAMGPIGGLGPPAGRGGAFQGQIRGPPPMGFPPEGMVQERAPRRRRTDTRGGFTDLPFSLPPTATSLPPVSGYLPPQTQGQTSLPPLRIDNTAQPTRDLAPVTTAGPPQPFDPYGRGQYDRGWEGGRR
jgi:hypothetical protein